jgi:hypothetical protein
MAAPVQSLTPRSAIAITPSDTTVYDNSNMGPLAGLYIGSVAGGAGVTVVTANGETVTFSGVPVGTILPITCTKVTAATTASAIVGLRY